MVTLKGLTRTLTIIKNPFSAILLKFRNKRTSITFSNGSIFLVTWSQFRFLRDHYDLVKKYNLKQLDSETFKITTDRYQLIGSQILIGTLNEIESGIYDCDCKGKVVLDIGGFEGESAVYLWSLGASKVVIYEPVVEHRKHIEENIRLNNMNAELYSEGIGNLDGEVTIGYNKTDNCFGLNTESQNNKIKIKIKDISRIISESGAEVAKIDCEGAEISLVDVPKEVLRKIEYAMIEVHSVQIRRALIQKFESSGFILEKSDEEFEGPVSLVYFKRLN